MKPEKLVFRIQEVKYIYRIVPNRREGLGARLLISQKWDECGHSLDQLLN